MRYWLKLGYFTDAATEGEAAYWHGRSWVSDSPGRQSPRWDSQPRPRRGQLYPPYGPKYEVGDRLVVYVKGRGCPAILEVTAKPRWDPRRVDEEAERGEGNRWGVVTEVKGLHAVALVDAPQLDAISVAPTSVMRKGHLELQEWQYRQAEALIAGRRRHRARRPRRALRIPIEQGEVEGYEVVTSGEVRRAVRRESRLVRSYAAFLEAQGEVVERTKLLPSASVRPLFSDVFNPARNQLIEAKAGSSRNDIRMAIGQLADYGRFLGPDARRAVLLDARPHPDLLDLLQTQSISAIWRQGDGFADNANGLFT